MKSGLGWLAVSIVGLLVIGAVVLGGWQAGWWFSVKNAERQGQLINIEGHNYRKSYGFQQTERDQITQLIQNVDSLNVQILGVSKNEAQALEAQRYAILGQLCGDAAQISGDPLIAAQQLFVDQNCDAGAVSSTSKYAPQP